MSGENKSFADARALMEQATLKSARLGFFAKDIAQGRIRESEVLRSISVDISDKVLDVARANIQKALDAHNKLGTKDSYVARRMELERRLTEIDRISRERNTGSLEGSDLAAFYKTYAEAEDVTKEEREFRGRVLCDILKASGALKSLKEGWMAEVKENGGALSEEMIIKASAANLALAAIMRGWYRSDTGIFDEQFMATLLAVRGWNAVELATGEGKTLVTAVVSAVNAISGKGSLAVVTKDAAAKDAFDEWHSYWDVLGFTVGMRLNESYKDEAMLSGTKQTSGAMMSPSQIRAAYDADITYVSIQNLAFDYSHDKLQVKAGETSYIEGGRFGRKLPEMSMTIDEMDSVLIDQAMTSFIRAQGGGKLLTGDPLQVRREFAKLVEGMHDVSRDVSEVGLRYAGTDRSGATVKGPQIVVNEDGTHAYAGSRAERAAIDHLGYLADHGQISRAFYDLLVKRKNAAARALAGDEYTELTELGRQYLNNAVQAKWVYRQGSNYWIDNGEVKLISKELGITQQGQRLNELHQAIEARIRVIQEDRALNPAEHDRFTVDPNGKAIPLMEIRAENLTESSVTARDVLLAFGKVSGMSGTLNIGRISTDLRALYGMTCYTIPSHDLNRRVDGFEILMSSRDRLSRAKELIRDAIGNNRSVLINAHTDRERDEIYEQLSGAALGKEVKLARFGVDTERSEAALVRAIKENVTILVATNIAGRGTDFKISEEARRAGGLLQINWGINKRFSTDRQASGRSGRSGEMGESYTLLVQGEESIYSEGLLRTNLGWLGVADGFAKNLARFYEKYIGWLGVADGFAKNLARFYEKYITGEKGIGAASDSVEDFVKEHSWFKLIRMIGWSNYRELTSGKYRTIGEAVYRIAQANVEKLQSEQLQFRARRGDRTYGAQIASKDLLDRIKEDVSNAVKLRYRGGVPALIRSAVREAMIESWDGKTLNVENIKASLEARGMLIEFSQEIRALCENNASLNREALEVQIERALTDQAITSLAESLIGRVSGKWFQAMQKLERDHGFSKNPFRRAWNGVRYYFGFNREFRRYIGNLEKVWLDARGETYGVSQVKVLGFLQKWVWNAVVMNAYYWLTGKSRIKEDLEGITLNSLNESVGDRMKQVVDNRAKEEYEKKMIDEAEANAARQFSKTSGDVFAVEIDMRAGAGAFGKNVALSDLAVQRRYVNLPLTAGPAAAVHRDAASTAPAVVRNLDGTKPTAVPPAVQAQADLMNRRDQNVGVITDSDGSVYIIGRVDGKGDYRFERVNKTPGVSLPPEAYRQLLARLEGNYVYDRNGNPWEVRMNAKGVIMIGQCVIGAGVDLPAGTVLFNASITTSADAAIEAADKELKAAEEAKDTDRLAAAKTARELIKSPLTVRGPFMMTESSLEVTREGSEIHDGVMIENSNYRGRIVLRKNSKMTLVTLRLTPRQIDEQAELAMNLQREGSIELGEGAEAYMSAANYIKAGSREFRAYQGAASGREIRGGLARVVSQRDGVVIRQFGFLARWSAFKYRIADLFANFGAIGDEIRELNGEREQNIAKHNDGIRSGWIRFVNAWNEDMTFLGKVTAGTGLKQAVMAGLGYGLAILIGLHVAVPAVLFLTLGVFNLYKSLRYWAPEDGKEETKPLDMMRKAFPDQDMFMKIIPVAAGYLIHAVPALQSLWLLYGFAGYLALRGIAVHSDRAARLFSFLPSAETGVFVTAHHRLSTFRSRVVADTQSVLRQGMPAGMRRLDEAIQFLGSGANRTETVGNLVEEGITRKLTYEQTPEEEAAACELRARLDALKAEPKEKIRKQMRRQLAEQLADAILGLRDGAATAIRAEDRDRAKLVRVLHEQIEAGQIRITAGSTAELSFIYEAAPSKAAYLRMTPEERMAANAKWLAENGVPNAQNIKVVFSRAASIKVGKRWKFIGVKNGRTWEDREGAQAIISTNFRPGSSSPFAVAGFTALTEKWDKGSSIHELTHFNSLMRQRLKELGKDTDSGIGLEEVFNFLIQYRSGLAEAGRGVYNIERVLDEKMTQYGHLFGEGLEGKRNAKLAFMTVLYMEEIGLSRWEIMNILGRITTVQDLIQFQLYTAEDIAKIRGSVALGEKKARAEAADKEAEDLENRVKVAQARLDDARKTFEAQWADNAGKREASAAFRKARELKEAAETERSNTAKAARRARAKASTADRELEAAQRKHNRILSAPVPDGVKTARQGTGDLIPNMETDLTWPRISRLVNSWMGESFSVSDVLARILDASPKERLWMFYELTKRADSREDDGEGVTAAARAKAKSVLAAFYADKDAQAVLIGLVRVARSVLHGQRDKDRLESLLLTPVLISAPEYLQTKVTEYTGWLPVAQGVLKTTAEGRQVAEESYYAAKTQELVDARNWRELEEIVRGKRGNEETRAWTVYYLYLHYRYDANVRRVLSYFESVRGHRKHFEEYKAAVQTKAARLQHRLNETEREGQTDVNLSYQLSRELLLANAVIRGIVNAKRGYFGTALTGERLIGALRGHVHQERDALEKLEGLSADLTPSGDLLADHAVTAADADALAADVELLIERGDIAAAWDAIGYEMIYTNRLSGKALTALRNYKLWGHEAARRELLARVFEAYMKRALGEEAAQSALVRFSAFLPASKEFVVGQDASSRSVVDNAYFRGEAERLIAARGDDAAAADAALAEANSATRVWTLYYLFRDHFEEPAVRKILSRYISGKNAYADLTRLAREILALYPGDENGHISEPMLRGIFEAIAGSADDEQVRMLGRILRKDRTKEDQDGNVADYTRMNRVIDFFKAPDERRQGLDRTVAARVWDAMLFQSAGNAAVKTYLRKHYVKHSSHRDFLAGIGKKMTSNRESVFAYRTLPSAEDLFNQGRMKFEVQLSTPAKEDDKMDAADVVYAATGARRAGYSSASFAYDLDFSLHNHPSRGDGRAQILPSGKFAQNDGLYQVSRKTSDGKFERTGYAYIVTEYGILRYSVVNTAAGEAKPQGSSYTVAGGKTMPLTPLDLMIRNDRSLGSQGRIDRLAFDLASRGEDFSMFLDDEFPTQFEFRSWRSLAGRRDIDRFVINGKNQSMVRPMTEDQGARILAGMAERAESIRSELRLQQDGAVTEVVRQDTVAGPAEATAEPDLGVAGLAAALPATREAFVSVIKSNLLAAAPAAGIELSEAAKRLQMMTPARDPRLQGKLGFYTDPAGADAFGIMALNSQKAEAFYQKIQGKTVLTLEERDELQDIMAELLVALAHENEHAHGGAEVRAYRKSIDVAKLVKMPKFDLLYVLLDHARAEEEELKRVQDALQLVDQKGMTVRRAAIDILSSLNNSRTVAILSPELSAINGVESVGDVAGLGKYLRDARYIASANHTVFFIEDAKLKMPGMPEALERLRKAGFPIFVYSESDIGGGADRVFYLGQFAAWVGVEEFRRLMPEMYHENRSGYFSVTAYLSNALIRTLLNEIMAEQQVAQAA
jgi:hypothetical protein